MPYGIYNPYQESLDKGFPVFRDYRSGLVFGKLCNPSAKADGNIVEFRFIFKRKFNIRYSVFPIGIPHGALFDIYPALKGRNQTARGRVSAANASERSPGLRASQTRHRPGSNKGDDGYPDDSKYDLRQSPQRYHDLSLPAVPDFRSLSEFIKKPLQIQITGFLNKKWRDFGGLFFW